MKLFLFLAILLAGSLTLTAQETDSLRMARALPEEDVLSPLQYLASDRLKGRHIGLPEIDMAARYIAQQFKNAGVRPVPGDSGYYQTFRYRFTPRNMDHMDKQAASNIPSAAIHGLALKNVIAFQPGTDPVLRKQYIILSAHYDHVGVAYKAMMENGKMDNIFNGARDNASGTAAVIAAATWFGRYPPRRSILFICYTAEEEGEIGSKYYSQHPVIPLDHTVYNLNVDNAGYDTTHAISLFGLGRTSADSLIEKACNAYGLAVLPEPDGYALFTRSDNYSLARYGVPAPTFSLGMKQWDAAVDAHYHQLSDEVDNMDLDYVVKFIRAFVLSAEYIANDPNQPRWTKGDPYEQTWKTLFSHRQL